MSVLYPNQFHFRDDSKPKKDFKDKEKELEMKRERECVCVF